jgi:hypothetical protein
MSISQSALMALPRSAWSQGKQTAGCPHCGRRRVTDNKAERNSAAARGSLAGDLPSRDGTCSARFGSGRPRPAGKGRCHFVRQRLPSGRNRGQTTVFLSRLFADQPLIGRWRTRAFAEVRQGECSLRRKVD